VDFEGGGLAADVVWLKLWIFRGNPGNWWPGTVTLGIATTEIKGFTTGGTGEHGVKPTAVGIPFTVIVLAFFMAISRLAGRGKSLSRLDCPGRLRLLIRF
jgi:hypothetical protein